MKLTQVLKWVGLVDGVVVSVATGMAQMHPQWAMPIDEVIEVAALLTSAMGVAAHLSAGSQTVTVAQAVAAASAKEPPLPVLKPGDIVGPGPGGAP